MASLKAEKPLGTQLSGQVKKEPASKASEGGGKGSSKASKKAAPKQQESKKKVRTHKLC